MGGAGGGGNLFGAFGGGGPSMSAGPQSSPAQPTRPASSEMVKPLAVTLEELYSGSTRRLQVTKKRRFAPGSEEASPSDTLSVTIKPGYKSGTKITFRGAGGENSAGGGIDVVFLLQEKEHPVFKRVGDDLFVHLKVSSCLSLLICYPATACCDLDHIMLMLGARSCIRVFSFVRFLSSTLLPALLHRKPSLAP